MTIDKMPVPKTTDEAREQAIKWQHRQSEQSMSWGEVGDQGAYFEELATKFDLTEEFKENGII